MDEGTTSARAILFDQKGNIVAMAQHEISQNYPEPGWVEQDAMEIFANQYAAMTECIAKSGIRAEEIGAVGITNQRETVVAWNRKTGRPITGAIVWQCRRTSQMCRELEEKGYGPLVRERTGLRLDPYFSGTKIKWILEHVEEARALAKTGDLLVGTVDTWLVWKFTEGRVFVTDRTNASRTMLMDLKTGTWDEKMLALLGIDEKMLPEIKSSSEIYGEFECFGVRLPIAGIAGDQQAALFGQGCFFPGEAKNTYGTGCFLLANIGKEPILSQNGLLTTVVAGERASEMEYALEGSVFVGGAVIKWLRDGVGLISESGDSEYFAGKVKDSGGVYFVPAFSGLGAPYWMPEARGTLVGLTAGTGRNHIIRAALESIAHQTDDVILAMNRDMKAVCGKGISVLKVDGGASANALLLQLQSDLSDLTVERFDSAEATALGAAFLAGLSVGIYKSREELKEICSSGERFESNLSVKVREEKRKMWRRAILAAQTFGGKTE